MATYDPKTTAYVFVPGVSHPAVFFDALCEEFKSRGYDAEGAVLPTLGDPKDTEGLTLQDEYAAIQRYVDKFADQGKDVVLVGHSYGGWPASRAVKGYDKESRKAAGKPGGIVELAFFAAFLLPEDADMKTVSFIPPFFQTEGSHETGVRKPMADSVGIFFSDMTPEQQREWYGKLQWHRNAFVGDTVPDAPWGVKTLNKRYVVHTDDPGMPLAMEMDMLAKVVDETWTLQSMRCGHASMVTHTKQLADVLLAPRY